MAVKIFLQLYVKVKGEKVPSRVLIPHNRKSECERKFFSFIIKNSSCEVRKTLRFNASSELTLFTEVNEKEKHFMKMSKRRKIEKRFRM